MNQKLPPDWRDQFLKKNVIVFNMNDDLTLKLDVVASSVIS